MGLCPRSRLKLQEMAIKHGVPEFGLPYLTMIKRIRESSNSVTKEEEELLRALCREMGTDYDRVFGKPKER